MLSWNGPIIHSLTICKRAASADRRLLERHAQQDATKLTWCWEMEVADLSSRERRRHHQICKATLSFIFIGKEQMGE